VPAERVTVIRSGVDVSRFAPQPPDPAIQAELGLPSGVPVIGKIANAAPWKGQNVFLEAAAILTRKGRKVHFLLAGRDTMGEWVRGQVAALGLAGRVTLAGFRQDIPKLLPCLSVSVNAAVGGEGLSGALRESLCMGVPVVASDMAGNRELLFGADPRFLFKPGDAQALAERLEWALDHEKEAKAFVAQWRQRLDAEFSIEQMVAKTDELYRRLLGR
jgi:glycosyltransferase involved in cell wall biosynthesis